MPLLFLTKQLFAAHFRLDLTALFGIILAVSHNHKLK